MTTFDLPAWVFVFGSLQGILLTLHFVGDYLFQSHWMAVSKTSESAAAVIHACMYSVPFFFFFFLCLPFYKAFLVFLVVAVPHFLIDRYRLVRYVIWAKNMLAPPDHRYSLESSDNFGWPKGMPSGLSIGLGFTIDNTLHIVTNSLFVAAVVFFL